MFSNGNLENFLEVMSFDQSSVFCISRIIKPKFPTLLDEEPFAKWAVNSITFQKDKETIEHDMLLLKN